MTRLLNDPSGRRRLGVNLGMAPAFPVNTQEFTTDIDGVSTSFIISAYADRIMVVATQLGTFGTVLSARCSICTVKTILATVSLL